MGSIVNVCVAPTTPLEFPLTTHFAMLARGIFYRGAGLDVVWKSCAILFAIGAVLFRLVRTRATIGTMV